MVFVALLYLGLLPRGPLAYSSYDGKLTVVSYSPPLASTTSTLSDEPPLKLRNKILSTAFQTLLAPKPS